MRLLRVVQSERVSASRSVSSGPASRTKRRTAESLQPIGAFKLRGAYVAAINRAQLALSEYRNVPAAEDALGILLNAYGALGMDQLRDDARRVLEKNYPQSVYLTQGVKARAQPWWKLW